MQDYRTFDEWADTTGLPVIVGIAKEIIKNDNPQEFYRLLGLIYQAGVEAGFDAEDCLEE